MKLKEQDWLLIMKILTLVDQGLESVEDQIFGLKEGFYFTMGESNANRLNQIVAALHEKYD